MRTNAGKKKGDKSDDSVVLAMYLQIISSLLSETVESNGFNTISSNFFSENKTGNWNFITYNLMENRILYFRRDLITLLQVQKTVLTGFLKRCVNFSFSLI